MGVEKTLEAVHRKIRQAHEACCVKHPWRRGMCKEAGPVLRGESLLCPPQRAQLFLGTR